MIRVDEIQDKLLHLIGWEQNYNTSDFKIADSLTESESGIYFQQVHPLLTLRNLQCIAPDFQNIEHETYTERKSYVKGNVVECLGKLYRALKDNKEYPPVKSWKEPLDAVVCDLKYKLIKLDDGSYVRDGEPEKVNCREYDSRYYEPREVVAVDRDIVNLTETKKYNLFNIGSPASLPYKPEDYWEEIDLFSEWLETKTKASISKAVMRFVNEKLSTGTGTALCENRILFDGTGRLADKIKNKGRFVGFEIVPVRSKGVTLKIDKIGLQFTKPGKYTLYLFHSSSYEPVRILEVEKKTANGIEWFAFPDLYLPYVTETTDAGGSWYIGYLQNDLPEGSEAVRKERDWSKGPCRECSRREFLAWEAWSKYLEIHPFYVDERRVINRQYKLVFTKVSGLTGNTVNGVKEVIWTDAEDYALVPSGVEVTYKTEYDHSSYPVIGKDIPVFPEGTEILPVDAANLGDLNVEPRLWDVSDNIYTYDNNYGLNLEVSVGCDFTDFIIRQRAMFQDVVAKQVAVDMLREFAFNANVRTNRHSINASRVDIMFEIDGDSSQLKKSGLANQLDQAFKALKVDTAGVDRICMPCRNNGVKYRTV